MFTFIWKLNASHSDAKERAQVWHQRILLFVVVDQL